MLGVASQNQGESTNLGGPQNIRVAGGLGSPLNDALVNGTELVHVIALI